MSYGDLARAASTQGKVLERQGLANQRLSKVHASSYFNGVLKLGKISSTRIPAQCGTTIKDLQNGSPNTRFPARDLTRARPA